jgi:fumarylpyruvate hydrolase
MNEMSGSISKGYVVAAPKIATLPVLGEQGVFPINRVYCVGRNYAAHAKEMGHDAAKEPPFFFAKPADAVYCGEDFPYPTKTKDLHHEIELVVALAKGGTDISAANALDHVYGYAVGLDMTRRDLQEEAKKMGRPWETGKGFDQAGPCTAIRRASEIGHPSAGRVWLEVNGQIKQQGDLKDLIWGIPQMIEFLSGYFALKPGDLIFTGTPAGVGAVKRGDKLRGGVDGVGELTTRIV